MRLNSLPIHKPSVKLPEQSEKPPEPPEQSLTLTDGVKIAGAATVVGAVGIGTGLVTTLAQGAADGARTALRWGGYALPEGLNS